MDLIKELNIKNLSEEEKNEILVKFTDSLLKRLMLRVCDKLNKDEQKEFDKLSGEGDIGKINKFLGDKIPDLNQIRDEEVAGLVDELKDFVKMNKK